MLMSWIWWNAVDDDFAYDETTCLDTQAAGLVLG
jgi:hypothetical protein